VTRLFTTARSLSDRSLLCFVDALAKLALDSAKPAARAKLPKPLVRLRP